MIIVPEYLKHVSHPCVASMYMKRGLRGEKRTEDVLVIETRQMEFLEEEDYMKLLSDLNGLCQQASEEVGTFDRVDIRVC